MTVWVSMTLKTELYDCKSQYEYDSWHWKHQYHDCRSQYDTENISIMTVWVSMTLKTSALWLYESVWHWKHQHYDCMSQYDTENSIITVWVSMTLKTSALWLYESIRLWHWKHQYYDCISQYDTENISIMTVWLYESIWFADCRFCPWNILIQSDSLDINWYNTREIPVNVNTVMTLTVFESNDAMMLAFFNVSIHVLTLP